MMNVSLFHQALLSLLIASTALLNISHALPPGYLEEAWAKVSGTPVSLIPTTDPTSNETSLLVVIKEGRILHFDHLDDDIAGPRHYTLLTIPEDRLCTNGERGLLSAVLHPHFYQADGVFSYIYVYYSHASSSRGGCPYDFVDGPQDWVSKLYVNRTSTGWSVDDWSTEQVLLKTPPQGTGEHNGGHLLFGNDDYLYVSVGDDGSRPNYEGQDGTTIIGKLLRVTDTGGIPQSNPYAETGVSCAAAGNSSTGSTCAEIFAWGLRNVFQMQIHPHRAGTQIWMNDVGRARWEEINECGDGTALEPTTCAGANFGWMDREGPCAFGSLTRGCDPVVDVEQAGYTDPVHYYNHRDRRGGGAAIVGGDWPPLYQWPVPQESFFFSDFVFGEIFLLYPDPQGGCRSCRPPVSSWKNETFHDLKGGRAIDVKFVPYLGTTALYYSCRRCDTNIHRIRYVGGDKTPPIAVLTASESHGTTETRFQFDASRSYDKQNSSLRYEWDLDDGTESTLINPTKQYSSNGTKQVTLTVFDSVGFFDIAQVEITVGIAPTLVIDEPQNGKPFQVGDVLTLRGRAFDPNGTQLSDSSLVWEVRRHHNTHYHQWMAPTRGNNLEVRPAPRPEDFVSATNSYLKVLLTAGSSAGVNTTIEQNVLPRLVYMNFESSPRRGYDISIDGFTITTPYTAIFWVNEPVQLLAMDNSPDLNFLRWSGSGDSSRFDGAGRSVTLSILAADNNTDVTVHLSSPPSPGPSWLPTSSSMTPSSVPSFSPTIWSEAVLLRRRETLFPQSPKSVGGVVLQLERDGNLVLRQPGERLWQTGKRGVADGKYFLILQGDCNLIVWRGVPGDVERYHWKTNRRDTSSSGCFLGASAIDESVSVYRGSSFGSSGTRIWTNEMTRSVIELTMSPTMDPSVIPSLRPSLLPTISSSPTGRSTLSVLLRRSSYMFQGSAVPSGVFTIELETDGNLRILYNRKTTWETGIRGEVGDYYLKLQGDCNLVLRRGSAGKSKVVWKSGPSHPKNGGCFLGASLKEGRISIYRGSPEDFDGSTYWTDAMIKPP